MVRHARLYGLTLGVVLLGGCSHVASDSIGVDGPCTRSSDCLDGLRCQGGVCTAPDAGLSLPDSGMEAGDGAMDGGNAG